MNKRSTLVTFASAAVLLGLFNINNSQTVKADTVEQGVLSLVQAIKDLMKELNMPMSVEECGIDKETYFAAIERLALDAFDDQCTPANPRLPLVTELHEIYKNIYPSTKVKCVKEEKVEVKC